MKLETPSTIPLLSSAQRPFSLIWYSPWCKDISFSLEAIGILTLLTMLEICQPRRYPQCEVPIRPHIIWSRSPSRVLAQMPCIVVDFPWLRISSQENNTKVFSDQQVSMPCEMFNYRKYQGPSIEGERKVDPLKTSNNTNFK